MLILIDKDTAIDTDSIVRITRNYINKEPYSITIELSTGTTVEAITTKPFVTLVDDLNKQSKI